MNQQKAGKTPTAETASVTPQAQGAQAKPTPADVAIPLPPWNLSQQV